MSQTLQSNYILRKAFFVCFYYRFVSCLNVTDIFENFLAIFYLGAFVYIGSFYK